MRVTRLVLYSKIFKLNQFFVSGKLFILFCFPVINQHVIIIIIVVIFYYTYKFVMYISLEREKFLKNIFLLLIKTKCDGLRKYSHLLLFFDLKRNCSSKYFFKLKNEIIGHF